MVARVWYWCIELLGIGPQVLLVTRQRFPSFRSIANCGSARARGRAARATVPVAYCMLCAQGRMLPCREFGAVLGLYKTSFLCVASVETDLSAQLVPLLRYALPLDAHGTCATSNLPLGSLGHLQSIPEPQSPYHYLYILVVMYGTTVPSQAGGGMGGRSRVCGRGYTRTYYMVAGVSEMAYVA